MTGVLFLSPGQGLKHCLIFLSLRDQRLPVQVVEVAHVGLRAEEVQVPQLKVGPAHSPD